LVNFYALPKTTLWVNNCLDKKERIALSLTSPKIIFTSGSNTLFGLRAKDVENNLSIPSVNMAVHAGLEPDYILYRAKKVLKSGDTIVLLFEYEDLLWDGSYDETRVGEILTYDKNYRDTLSLEDRYDLYKNLTFFDILKSIKDQIRKSEEEPVGTAYNSTTLNSRGDETYNFNQKIIQNNMKKAYQPFEIKKLDTRGLKEILKFKKWCDEKNIKVFVSWPSIVYVKEYDSVKYQQFFNDLVEYFRMHNIQILGQPRDFILPQSLFYDTEYHLNSTGMTIRTQKVIKLLQEQGYGAPPTQSMSPR
jgi:hypothetical protein